MDVVVLVSGRGSNLKALLEAIDDRRCAATIAAVVSDRASAPALELARSRGIACAIVSPADHPTRDAWDEALSLTVLSFAPGLVVLAGFMRIVGKAMLSRFGGRIINVHPALLPAFPGMDGPAQAVQKRVSLSGCTVHLVDSGVDTGPILAQAAVPVLAEDDASTLHTRIQKAEHRLLPAVVHAIAEGKLRLTEQGPAYTAEALEADRIFAWPPLI